MYDYDGDVDAQVADAPLHDEYGALFGYAAEFFAGLLLPQRALCHRKFELAVDDLFFVGHPVCADDDGTWRFKHEKDARGRGAHKRRASAEASVSADEVSSSTGFESSVPLVTNTTVPSGNFTADAFGFSGGLAVGGAGWAWTTPASSSTRS